MVWYGSPEYNARLKAAGKRIALDHILRELLIELVRMHESPGAAVDDLQARVNHRFQLENQPGTHELHVHAEAVSYANEYFEEVRAVLQKANSSAAGESGAKPAA